jgi:hypothetical protein
MEGWLYVMSNEGLKLGLIKIGRTNDLRQHMQDLYGKGVASPYRVAYKGLVDDYEEVEAKVHAALEDYRINPERDFFECSIANAILTIQESAHIMSEEINFKDESQFELEQQVRKQAKLLLQHNDKLKKTREQFIEDEGIWLDKPSFYVTVFLALVAFILFPEMDEYFRDNSAIKWFLVAIPPYIYWHFASQKYKRNYRELSIKAEKMFPQATAYEEIAPPEVETELNAGETGDASLGGELSIGDDRIRGLKGSALGIGESSGDSADASLGVRAQDDDATVQVTQAKISWVCHYCATDNTSSPAAKVVCIRCNRSSSMEGVV